ncbi:MAG: hypothetical protein GYA62_01570 [Bacteroidales bacterium]|nr:hypothetical protein [Bacteroidales bacterium]
MRRTIKKYLSESREQKEVIDGKIISKDIFGRATVQTATGTFKAIDLRGKGTTGVKINNAAQNQNEFAIIAGNQERNIMQPTYYDLPVAKDYLAVLDVGNYRVQLLSKTGSFVNSFGNEETFGMIRGMAISSGGNVYISESYPGYKVYKFDLDGNFIKELPTDKIFWPMGICIKNNSIFITNGSYVEEFTIDDLYIKNFNFKCSYPSSYIYDIAIDSDDNFIVTFYQNNIVRKFNSIGSLIFTLGTQSSYDKGSNENGKFWSPRGVAVDSQNNIYVCDAFNYRVQKFDSDGNFLLKFGSKGSGNGQFNMPWDVCIDNKDNLYISDLLNNRIQVFSSSGNFIRSIGTQGSGNGQFNMPMAIDIFER